MEKTRPILYGVADYAEIRRANAWFIDRTAKIRDLEATRYAIFLRPRRFGKSLWTSILEAYYDVRFAGRFDEFFAGTDIGADPTDERGKYLVLRFDDINSGLCDFAEKGEWRGFIDILSSIVKENFAVRDSVEGEKVVQSTLVALLTAADGPYLVRHEREAGGSFYDIALKPQLDKYSSDPALTHGAMGSSRPTVSTSLPAPSGGRVRLHRFVLVFHGGDCVLSDEV